MSRNVLIVDDERGFAEALARRLELRGHAAQAATSPDEALEAARREAPDVVLLDLRMPGTSPADLVASLRREAPGSRVVLLSGQPAPCPGLEGLPCLAKPLVLAEVLAAIEGGGGVGGGTP